MIKALSSRLTLKRILTGIGIVVLVYLLSLGFASAFLSLQYQCLLKPCQSSWALIREFALQPTKENDQEYLVSEISALVELSGQQLDRGEVGNVRIGVSYIAIQKDSNGYYHHWNRMFDDQSFWPDDSDSVAVMDPDAPSSAFQDRLRDAKIGPREAYKIVWGSLHPSAQLISDTALFQMNLMLSDAQIPKQYKLVWKFRFPGSSTDVQYEVDATNGNLFKDK